MTGSASTSLTLSRISFDSDSGSAVVVGLEVAFTTSLTAGVTIATCGVEFGVLIDFVDKSAKVVVDSVVPATTEEGMAFKTCMVDVGDLGAA